MRETKTKVAMKHLPHGLRSSVLDETELIASDFTHLGENTLPGYTTTKAAAVVMIMAFVITHNLTLVVNGDLLRLVGALFGFKGNVIPRSKYLFRKVWASRTASIGKNFFTVRFVGLYWIHYLAFRA